MNSIQPISPVLGLFSRLPLIAMGESNEADLAEIAGLDSLEDQAIHLLDAGTISTWQRSAKDLVREEIESLQPYWDDAVAAITFHRDFTRVRIDDAPGVARQLIALARQLILTVQGNEDRELLEQQRHKTAQMLNNLHSGHRTDRSTSLRP